MSAALWSALAWIAQSLLLLAGAVVLAVFAFGLVDKLRAGARLAQGAPRLLGVLLGIGLILCAWLVRRWVEAGHL